jgi:hypothetical protein
MLKLTGRLLLVTASVFLLMCLALSFSAQAAPSGGQDPKPTPQPTRNKNGKLIDVIKQGTKVSISEGIYGAIRWKKEYGFPSTDDGKTPNKALNCTAFRVTATVQEGAPGTFGQATAVGYWTVQNEPSEENGYYVCRYSITNRNTLPHDRVITVLSFLGPFASADLNRALTTGGWYGAGSPRPPAGSQRVVTGSRGVTLTDSAKRVTVDFEMVYRPIPSGPR